MNKPLPMFLSAALVMAATLGLNAVRAEVVVTAAPGDNLARLLRRHGGPQSRSELQALIEQTLRDNPQAFRGGDPDRLIPFSTLRLPLAAAPPRPPAPTPPAGELRMVRGSALLGAAQRQRRVSGSDLFHAGEQVRTAADSRATLTFSDGARVELGPSAEFHIDSYRSGNAQTPGRAVLRLIRGAIRALSGAIGKRAGDVYRLDTATATIGIRGTEYVARFCSADCGDLLGASVAVTDGAVTLANRRGELALAQGEFGRVASADALPVAAPLPAGFLDLDLDAGSIEADGGWLRQLFDIIGDWLG